MREIYGLCEGHSQWTGLGLAQVLTEEVRVFVLSPSGSRPALAFRQSGPLCSSRVRRFSPTP